MRVTQIASARFHHVDLARQLAARDALEAMWTGYPRHKFAQEDGVPKNRIRTAPMIYTPANLLSNRTPLRRSEQIRQHLTLAGKMAIDVMARQSITAPTIVYALSSHGLAAGSHAQKIGGKYVCDRGSTHISHQRNVLVDEAKRWGQESAGVISQTVRREIAEYAAADRIVVPSEYVRKTFLERGFAPEKVVKIPYGADLTSFGLTPTAPFGDFEVLFAGQVSLRKGFPYLLQAFDRLPTRNKRLRVAGTVQADMVKPLRELPLDGVEFLGPVSRPRLKELYNSSHMMVLPSLEEGLALVMAEAMACACPVIATDATGARDLFENGEGGIIVGQRDIEALVDSMKRVREENELFRAQALATVRALGGWDTYGDNVFELLKSLGVLPSGMSS